MRRPGASLRATDRYTTSGFKTVTDRVCEPTALAAGHDLPSRMENGPEASAFGSCSSGTRAKPRLGMKRTSTRRGAVAVEFAICASILFLLIFASLEFARMNMIRHSVDNAAYEAARCVIVPGATPAEAEAAARGILNVIWVQNSEIDVDPAVIQNSTPEVTVTVSVPADGNGFIAPHFFRGKSFVGRCRLTREDMGA